MEIICSFEREVLLKWMEVNVIEEFEIVGMDNFFKDVFKEDERNRFIVGRIKWRDVLFDCVSRF